ncbi:hypothetical protein G3A43_07440 [Paraburkholderia aspalathi]|nr:hypothetical protein [Paraburkholderia aspalathi]MBK3780087.1 hypothetical protein [Paraburkholderia aspalathi]
MLNELSRLATPALSYFTHALRAQCAAKGAVLARMRSGEWVTVEYVDGGFQSTDRDRQWLADGDSTVNHRFDLVEFAPANDVMANWTPLAVDVQARNTHATPEPLWH